MFLGYTPSGNRRYKPYTAENIIAQMKKEGLLSGENFDYGLSSLMSRFATKQKSIYSIDVIEQKSSGNEKTLRNNSKQHDTAINSVAHIQDVFKTKLVQQYNNDYKNASFVVARPNLRCLTQLKIRRNDDNLM